MLNIFTRIKKKSKPIPHFIDECPKDYLSSIPLSHSKYLNYYDIDVCGERNSLKPILEELFLTNIVGNILFYIPKNNSILEELFLTNIVGNILFYIPKNNSLHLCFKSNHPDDSTQIIHCMFSDLAPHISSELIDPFDS